ncbi:MAG: hypothetical protein ACU0BS_13440 [Hasllibacter sp.]
MPVPAPIAAGLAALLVAGAAGAQDRAGRAVGSWILLHQGDGRDWQLQSQGGSGGADLPVGVAPDVLVYDGDTFTRLPGLTYLDVNASFIPFTGGAVGTFPFGTGLLGAAADAAFGSRPDLPEAPVYVADIRGYGLDMLGGRYAIALDDALLVFKYAEFALQERAPGEAGVFTYVVHWIDTDPDGGPMLEAVLTEDPEGLSFTEEEVAGDGDVPDPDALEFDEAEVETGPDSEAGGGGGAPAPSADAVPYERRIQEEATALASCYAWGRCPPDVERGVLQGMVDREADPADRRGYLLEIADERLGGR